MSHDALIVTLKHLRLHGMAQTLQELAQQGGPRYHEVLPLMDLLLKKGADVEYNDPYIPSLPAMRRYPHLQMASRALTPEYLRSCDCVLIVTDHSVYDWEAVAEHAPLIVDTRNALKGVAAAKARIIRA